MKFALWWEGKAIGWVTLEPQGLYQRVCCAYRAPWQVLGLYAETDAGVVYVGLCIPEGETYGITRRIPADRLKGISRFYLAPKGEHVPMRVPVSPNAPFTALAQLENARFLRDGTAFLIIDPER